MSNDFDVVIIGSGIGGLVCGCYLVAAGFKVCIVEKNEILGGYATSFSINGFKFNYCIRGFVGCSSGGVFNKILVDLKLIRRIKILRPEVYDIIQFCGESIAVHNDYRKTINELISVFPHEEFQIEKFFDFVLDPNGTAGFYKYRSNTFQQVIDRFFVDPKIKFFLNILRIDSGLSPTSTSAVADLMLIRGNFMDGGYFPSGGMQALINVLEDFLRQSGCVILKSLRVLKINKSENRAGSIILENKQELFAKTFVSNIDATSTFINLLGPGSLELNFKQRIRHLRPSTSVLIIHLAIDEDLRKYVRYKCAAIWDFKKSIGDGIVITLPSLVDPSFAPCGKSSVTLYFGVPNRGKEYWQENKAKFENMFLERFYRVFPEVRDKIIFHQTYTPTDLETFTGNRIGATRGWAPLLSQSNQNFPQSETPIVNLFMAGHWVNTPFGNGGFTFAAHSGKSVARKIVRHSNVF